MAKHVWVTWHRRIRRFDSLWHAVREEHAKSLPTKPRNVWTFCGIRPHPDTDEFEVRTSLRSRRNAAKCKTCCKALEQG